MPIPGCLALLFVWLLLLLPFFFIELMATALHKLHLSTGMAVLSLIGIFLGGLINIPIRRLRHDDVVHVEPTLVFGVTQTVVERESHSTILAVNVGGCIVPLLLVLHQCMHIVFRSPGEILLLATITLFNIWACYRLARPIRGVGIAVPAFLPPLLAALPSWFFAGDLAPSIAFVAGTLGPLAGGDLLHLRDLRWVRTPVASIGGAGTFDGIVLSGILAAFLA